MSAGNLSPELIRAEASLRVRRAKELIQRAQNDLNQACSELSTLCGGCQVWKATSSQADKVRALWYRVDAFDHRGKYHLDSTHVEALRREAAEGRS